MFVVSHEAPRAEAKRSGVSVGQKGTPLRSVPHYERLFKLSLRTERVSVRRRRRPLWEPP